MGTVSSIHLSKDIFTVLEIKMHPYTVVTDLNVEEVSDKWRQIDPVWVLAVSPETVGEEKQASVLRVVFR